MADTILKFLPGAKRLEAGDFDLDTLTEILREMLIDEPTRNEILQLVGDSAELLMECLDKVISSGTFGAQSSGSLRSKALPTISRLSLRCQHLPRSYWIDPGTITLPNEPHASGAYAAIYRGAWNGKSVAVKVLRTSKQESLTKLNERFCKEVIAWKYMSWSYVLKFYGVFYHNGVPAIVTPWMPAGNITEYLEKRADANRSQLLSDVVIGVTYLHGWDIAHGDIKPPNILISEDFIPPRAILADFGSACLLAILAEMPDEGEEQGAPSFMAPELLLPTKFCLEKGGPSKEADVYALGMTMYQVLTGEPPFRPMRKAAIVRAVISGERPAKPEIAEEIGITEAAWGLLRECWREDRTKTEHRRGFRGILQDPR